MVQILALLQISMLDRDIVRYVEVPLTRMLTLTFGLTCTSSTGSDADLATCSATAPAFAFASSTAALTASATAATCFCGSGLSTLDAVVDRGAEVFARPWKTTSSLEPLEASESAGEGLRIAIWAMARVLLSGGKADEEVEGAMESPSDSEPESSVAAVAVTFSGSFKVPCSSPALTNSTGMLRSFLPASKAFLR